jgi:hypothetical protein
VIRDRRGLLRCISVKMRVTTPCARRLAGGTALQSRSGRSVAPCVLAVCYTIEPIGAIAAIEKCEIADTLRALDPAIESSGLQSFYARAGGLLSYGAEEDPWLRATSCTAIDFAARRRGD